MTDTGAFWDDLARDLEDPNFLREYVIESMRIAMIDAVANAWDDTQDSQAACLTGADAELRGRGAASRVGAD